MMSVFENVYLSTGAIVDFNAFKDDWTSILKVQYGRVGKEFLNNARKSVFVYDMIVKQDDEELTVEEIAALGTAYIFFAQQRSLSQADFIIATSNKDALLAVEQALDELRAENPFVEPSREDVVRSASENLKKTFKARVNLITNMETQAPSEEAKRLEALALAGVALLPFQPIDILPEAVQKTWVTVGDDLVRTSHAIANKQKRDVDDPFIVQGQRLMYPGDTKLGATIDNVARCRCSALYQRA